MTTLSAVVRNVGRTRLAGATAKFHATAGVALAASSASLARASLYARPCMRIANAIGFSLFGTLMWLLPIIAPGLFPRQAVDRTSAHAMWLQLLAVAHAAIATSILFRRFAPVVERWLMAEPHLRRHLEEVRGDSRAPVDYPQSKVGCSLPLGLSPTA